MKILKSCLLLACLALGLSAWGYRYQYETAPSDPMKTLIYTLPNGLKVYMTVNKDEPRIQTNIAVRVGSKNDPAETTGLAHYFEHMMFKGTPDFGTTDYAAEKPMLDQIEQLFEVYRVTTDSAARAQLYHQIDSISYQASLIAIPNEYDKLMSAIGANGTNAYTSYDMTCYVEDIPSNEIDRWAKIQANRFKNPVLRGFHTELETIYEEKNMSLTQDSRKMTEAMLSALFPDHPYGQWAVLGHQTHLKNPSITNIKNYHKQWYVPNNMAVIMSGDFDPDNVVDIITKYFGDMQPNPNLPKLHLAEQKPITEPKAVEVWGNEAEALILAWAFPGAKDKCLETLEIVDAMVNNGKAGLIDLDINKQQKALGVGTGLWGLSDRSAYLVQGRPLEGQSLDELKELILAEYAKLRNGDFDESLIPATINNYKLYQEQSMESNAGRMNILQNIFIKDLDLEEEMTALDRQSKLTKQQIVDFANKYLRDDNLVAIYKRQGPDPNELKIAKAPITPLATNRDASSAFLQEILSEKVEPIQPVFLDFDKDLTFLNANGNLPVLYKKNENNDLFQLIFVYDFGIAQDKELGMLGSYFSLLGTEDMTPEQLAQKFYELACSYSISVGNNRSYVVISGLSENMPQALALVEDLMANAKPDQEVYDKAVDRMIKGREDGKANQMTNFSNLRSYMIYGPELRKKMTVSNDEARALNPQTLTDKLSHFNDVQHSIIYYGPNTSDELLATINSTHRIPADLKPAPQRVSMMPIQPTETTFFIAPYDAKQLYMYQYTTEGKLFDQAIENDRQLYNEYFGGGMNSIVFQEMREARSLAYSAWASLNEPSYKTEPYSFGAIIATQNDKMEDAIKGFEEIIEQMPVSQQAFDLAKQGVASRLRTERIIKSDVAWQWLDNQDMGIQGDARKDLFEALPSLTLDEIVNFQQKNVKGRTYNICILGDPNDLDLDALRARGKVVLLNTDEIFPY
ncbi:MAG: insulinase family protein [Bacteroidales bacterium]|nr:insulinase family protein [Bacteroidales bacterium]